MEKDEMYESEYVEMENSQDKQSKKGRAKKALKFLRLPASAIAFGVIAAVTFQAINPTDSKELKANNKVESSTSIQSANTGTVKDGVSGVEQVKSTSGADRTDVSSVVENTMPAIVSIESTQVVKQQDIFGRVYNQQETGSGSGIIIGQNDKEVLIVTNNHVVAGATMVEIQFCDDSKASAEVKGTDSGSDLAVVSVPMESLSPKTKGSIRIASLGNSNDVKVGQMAIAIGNALGYGQSVTVGYISAKDREVATEDYTMKLLQTDAAINPGNSGGALLDSAGRVIGINSVKYSSKEVESMGYAIPISYATPIINDLMSNVKISEKEKAYLGITGQDVTDAISKNYGMPMGVYINEVSENSPAEKYGLKSGDIIVSFNNREIKSMAQLQEVLGNRKAGEKVPVKVSRLTDGKYVEKKLEVKLGNKSEMKETPQFNS